MTGMESARLTQNRSRNMCVVWPACLSCPPPEDFPPPCPSCPPPLADCSPSCILCPCMILPLSSRSARDHLPEDYGNICSLTWVPSNQPCELRFGRRRWRQVDRVRYAG